MTINIPEDRPEWPQDGLEHLGKCPVCGNPSRTLLYHGLIDRRYGAPGHWTMYLCDGCGSGYLDPRPNKATISLAYANYETHRPAATPLAGRGRLAARLRNGYLNTKYGYQMHPASPWGYLAMHLLPPPWRLEWDHYARHLPTPKPGRNKLLDVGCGNGEFLLRARSQGWDVRGIDFDAKALQHATEAGIPAIMGEISAEKFETASFDAITSHQVLEHTHKPLEFLSVLQSWLKHRGTIWIGTPNINSDLRREFGVDWYDLHPPQHLVIFSPDALIQSMRSVGFFDAKLIPRGYSESHVYRASVELGTRQSHSDHSTTAYEHENTLTIPQQLIRELSVWARPNRGTDFVAVATKN